MGITFDCIVLFFALAPFFVQILLIIMTQVEGQRTNSDLSKLGQTTLDHVISEKLLVSGYFQLTFCTTDIWTVPIVNCTLVSNMIWRK